MKMGIICLFDWNRAQNWWGLVRVVLGVLRMRPQNFAIVPESLAPNLEKVSEHSTAEPTMLAYVRHPLAKSLRKF